MVSHAVSPSYLLEIMHMNDTKAEAVAALAGALATAFERDLEHSREVHLATWRRRGNLHRVLDRAAGVLTPLL